MSDGPRTFQEFGDVRRRLEVIFNDVARGLQDIGGVATMVDLDAALRRLWEDRFRVAVVGEMKHGKSTMVNAMLGADPLPAWKSTACTASTIRVRFGDRKRAVCLDHSGRIARELDLEGDPGALHNHVTVDLTASGADSGHEGVPPPKYPEAIVSWPSGLLRDGVELLDTPGMHEGGTAGQEREAKVWAQLRKEANAIVLVFSCSKFGTASEDATIKRVLDGIVDRSALFVVMNRYDELRDDPTAAERVRSVVASRLAREGIDARRVFYLVAKDALRARSSNDHAALEGSGLPAFERALEAFLLHDRGAAKLLGSVKSAELGVRELAGCIARTDAELPALERSAKTAAARARSSLAEVEGARRSLHRQFDRTTEDVSEAARKAVQELLKEIRSGVRSELDQVRVSLSDATVDRADTRDRLIDRARSWCETTGQAWQEKFTKAVLSTKAADVISEGDRFARQVERVRDTLSETLIQLSLSDGQPNGAAGSNALARTDPRVGVDSIFDRSLSRELATTGVLQGGATGALVGGLLAITLSGPFLPFVAAAAAVGAMVGLAGAADRLRDKVASAIREALDRGAKALEDEVVGWASSFIRSAADRAVAGARDLEAQVKDLAEQIRGIDARRSEEAQRMRERCESLRALVRAHAQELANIRSAIDVAVTPSAFAQIIESVLRASEGAMPMAQEIELKVPQPPRLSLAYFLSELEDGADRRIDQAMDKLRELGRGRGDLRIRIAQFWSWLPDTDPQIRRAPKQVLAFRIVACLAASEDQHECPEPSALSKWIQDPKLLTEIEILGDVIGGDGAVRFSDSRRERESTPPILPASFVKSYQRGLELARPRAVQFRRETINRAGDSDAPRDMRG